MAVARDRLREFVLTDEALATMLSTVLPHLDERQRRIVAGSTARLVGRGGIVAVAEATEKSRSTVQKAVGEIDAGVEVSVRVRPPGAGRPKAIDAQPGLLVALNDLVEPESRGDPMCPPRWTTRSTRALAGELRRQGYEISHVTVADLLHQMGYCLQAPAKENEGAAHPDRDAQFVHLNPQVEAHLAAGEPIIGIDTKKEGDGRELEERRPGAATGQGAGAR